MVGLIKRKENKYLKEERKDVVSFFYKPKGVLKEAKYVFVWDLDKTYLDTQFETLSGLIKVIFEKALQKRNVAGTVTLIRSMAKKMKPFPLYFISASPPQMHDSIKEKWELDQIEPYGFLSKDNLKNLRPSRWKRLTNHIGFKIQALMELRLLIDKETKMICWGDDSESDATIYSLFSDLCAHRLTDREARAILSSLKVPSDQTELILEMRDQRDHIDPLSRVYINLAVDTDPEYYRKYGRRLMAVENSFEVALDLYQRGFIDEAAVINVGKDLIDNYDYKVFQIEESYDLLCKRRRLAKIIDLELRPKLVEAGLIGKSYSPSIDLMELEALPLQEDFEDIVRPWILERIDYLSEY